QPRQFHPSRKTARSLGEILYRTIRQRLRCQYKFSFGTSCILTSRGTQTVKSPRYYRNFHVEIYRPVSMILDFGLRILDWVIAEGLRAGAEQPFLNAIDSRSVISGR